MHTVINISKPATKWVQGDFLGKIVKLEAYASKQLSSIPVTLKKRVTYKKEISGYIDQIPAPGTTKTVNKAYQMSNGQVLYADRWSRVNNVVNLYRNGYWDLSWEFVSEWSGAPQDCHRWTLTNFSYVNGTKTTVKSYVYEDTGTEPAAGYGLPDFTDYPETITLTATDESTITLTLINEEITVEDTYCSGCDLVTIGWTENVQPQEFTLATLSIDEDSFAFVEPKDSDSGLPYFLCAGDEISIDTTQENANALNVLVYVEN